MEDSSYMKSSIAKCLLIPLIILSFAIVPLAGCSQDGDDTATEEVTDIKVGVLSLVSALPIFVAEDLGYFTDENLNVELITFNSALEEDAALQAGEIDGYFNDPINAIVMINGGVDMSIINSPYIANENDRMFAILVPSASEITVLLQLKGIEIAISYSTNIEYMQDKILEYYGFTETEFASQEIKQIPIRLQLLLSGGLEAAILPEPLISTAELQGARVIADDRVISFSETVIALDNSLMSKDPTLKERFLNACQKAANKLNTDPDSCTEIMYTRCNISTALQGKYEIPYFVVNHVPAEEEIDEIQEWLISKGVLSAKLPYDKIVK
jgi:NitT/TauT family transport system substrate-binding protein